MGVSESTDPFDVLGLDSSADLDAVHAARRRLAVIWHPDVGGDAEAMARINEAVRRCEALILARHAGWSDVSSPIGDRNQAGDSYADPGSDVYVVDHPSFRIEALPAEAHEALRIVGEWLGRVLVDDPPYLLEVVLDDPGHCWCQFHLIPEAGSSMVGLRISHVTDEPGPTARAVRDRVIESLNALDWGTLSS